ATTPFDAWAAAVSPRGLGKLAVARELELDGPFPAELAVELVGALRALRRLSIPAALVDAGIRRMEVLEIRVADEREGLAVAERALAPQRELPAELHVRLPQVTGMATLVGRALVWATALSTSLRRIMVRGSITIELTRHTDDRLAVMTATMPARGPRQ